MRLTPLLAGLAAALLAGSAPRAQSFLGSGPAERLSVPPSGDPLRRAPPRSVAPGPATAAPAPGGAAPGGPPAEAAATPAESVATLAPARRLPAGSRGFRLAGEADTLRFPVYLTPGQVRSGSRLRLAYLSAVSMAPEASELVVRLNGQKVGWTRIQAPGAVKVVEFALPDGALRPGYNTVEFAARQRHRVDCSVAATYELWTQIVPSRTGLVVPPAGADIALPTLAALEPDANGGLPVRLVVTEKPGLDRLRRMIEAVQAVALVGRLAAPSVEFGPPAAGRAGVNLIVGTGTELRGTEGIDGLGPVAGPRVALLPARPDRAPTLVVTGPGDADVAEAIRSLAELGAEPASGGAPVAALSRGYAVEGGETVTLADLGVASREFDGRLLRTRFELRFPADFVPADYGKVMIHLAGGSAAGLSPDARIIVDVNGRNAASVPLAYGKGELFEDNAIPIPLGAWRPGLNRVDISAQMPTASDATCDDGRDPLMREFGGRDAGRDAARFLLLDKTRIVVPALARAVRSPDLAALTAGAVPFTAGKRPSLVLPAPDRDSAAAAAMIVARLALGAGRLIPFDLTTSAAEPGSAALVVAPARALDPAMVSEAGLDPARLREAWAERAETVPAQDASGLAGAFTLDRLRRDLPVRCTLPPAVRPERVAGAAPPRARPPRPQAAVPSEPDGTASLNEPVSHSETDLVARWDERLRDGPSRIDRLSGFWQPVAARAEALWSRALDWAGTPSGTTVEIGDPRASLILAQSGGALEAGVTLVTAPNPWMLKASASCLVDPAVWSHLDGRADFLDATDGAVTETGPERVSLIETAPRGLANLWLVVAAWLALNPAVYVAVVLSVALALGLATTALVRDLGRRNG